VLGRLSERTISVQRSSDAIGDKRVEFSPPDKLVELILTADRVVTY
jgi:hypothetical protein